jgi:hypothetical protein
LTQRRNQTHKPILIQETARVETISGTNTFPRWRTRTEEVEEVEEVVSVPVLTGVQVV